MYATDEHAGRTETVTLYVSDPAASQEFYQDLFGLILHEQSGARTRRLLQAPGGSTGVSIVLRKRGADLEGPLWLSVEVGGVSEVLDLYLLATMMGARAMLPRKRGERWSTVLTDPDGNRISVWTRVDDEDRGEDPTGAALHVHRWEWRMTPPRGELAEDDLDQDLMETQFGRLRSGAQSLPGRSAVGADRLDQGTGHAGGQGGVLLFRPQAEQRHWKERSS